MSINNKATAMKLYTIYCIVSILLFISCGKDREKEISALLTNEDYKFWDIIQRDEKIYVDPYFSYYFNNQGEWIVFKYDNEGHRVKYNGGDISLVQSWKYISESSIIIGGMEYKINTLSVDTFIYSSKFGDVVKLVQSNNQLLN